MGLILLCFSTVKHDKKANLYNCKDIPLSSFKTIQLVCVGMNSVIKSRIYFSIALSIQLSMYIRIIGLVLAG